MEKKELTAADVWAMFAETDRQMKETDRKLKELGINVAGISNSNGKFAEELFYDSLEASKTFAGVHFDSISNEFGGQIKKSNGTLGSLSFNQRIIQEAKKYGVGLLKQRGNTIEYKADWVRAY
ncbi:hypothetical protein R83H12_00098 [Fibrobacteria bacterium R8-3-H12]